MEQYVGEWKKMIDIEKEKMIPLSDLANRLDLSYNTVNRMVVNGVRAIASGEIVKLEVVKTSSGRKTSVEAYYRFIGKLNEC